MDAIVNRTLRTPEDLADAGLVSADAVEGLKQVAQKYATALPPVVLHQINSGNDRSALIRQFVPSVSELQTAPQELKDPIGDGTHSPVKGVVHRYPDRVLLMPTLVCPVYCRFCFRREAVGPDGGVLTENQLHDALDYIRRTPAIWEVILTGGDPLILSPRRISEILNALNEIPHVKILRVHTRVPIAAPERIDEDLVGALRATPKPVYVALHCNHAAELSDEARAAIARLAEAGISLLSQSVLLKGVNDSVETLEHLFRELVQLRVKPYYLHQLDLAPGTGHFRVSVERGQSLVKQLRGRLSGLAQPTYMLDIPGGAGKVPLTPNHIETDASGRFAVEAIDGSRSNYNPPRPT